MAAGRNGYWCAATDVHNTADLLWRAGTHGCTSSTSKHGPHALPKERAALTAGAWSRRRTIVVVLADENGRQAPQARHVESLKPLTLVRGAVAVPEAGQRGDQQTLNVCCSSAREVYRDDTDESDDAAGGNLLGRTTKL